jgi:hypothetical protein
MCPSLLRHADAESVSYRHHEIHTVQPCLFEGKASGQPDRRASDALARPAGTHPITQVGETVDMIHLAQSDAAQ